MKELFIIKDSVTNRISYYHLACFLISLPFDFFYSQLVLISFAMHTVIHFKKERLSFLFIKATLIPISLYLLGLVCICYSADRPEGLNIAGRQSVILFIPVLFAFNELDLHKYKLSLLKIFAFSITGLMIYLYADAIHTISYFHLPLTTLFTTAFINHNFSLPIELHATYLSMYAALALFIFLYAALRESSISKKIIYTVSILILFAGIVQLTSRAVFASLLFIVPVGVSFFLLAGKRRIIFLSLSGVIGLSTFLIITKVNAFKMRYVSELKNDLTQVAINNEILEPRVARWELAFDLVKKAPLTGYGKGAEKDLMQQQYFQHKLYISYLQQFNVHSQYLSFLLMAGVIGLIVYLFVLYYACSIAVTNNDFLFFSFLALIAIVSLSENILDVNKGIFFYSFFLSFFLISNKARLFHPGNRETV
jgi:O-antigen ligase